MRPVLVGLAVVATLTTSLFGGFSLGGIPSAAACGGLYEQECVDPQDGAWEENPDYSERDIPYEDIEESRLISKRDKLADEYLAAEKSVATWWRWPIVAISDESGLREGTLEQYPPILPVPGGPGNEHVVYV